MFYCIKPKWIGGLLLFAAGNVLTFVALGMAPNSVLSCFNSWNIILTMVIAPWWFNEVVSRRTKYCAAVLVVGCVWVAIAGPKSYRKQQTIDHINKLFGYPAFLVVTACIWTFYLASLLKYREVRLQRDWDIWTVAMVATMASISASYAVLFSKCCSTLVQVSIASGHTQVRGDFFLYGVFAVLCGLSQIHFLNEALKHGESTLVIPGNESLCIAIQIAVGGILFQEYRHFTWQHHLYFWPGVVVVLGAVAVLTKFAHEDKLEQTKLAAEKPNLSSDAGAEPEPETIDKTSNPQEPEAGPAVPLGA